MRPNQRLLDRDQVMLMQFHRGQLIRHYAPPLEANAPNALLVALLGVCLVLIFGVLCYQWMQP